MRFTKMHGAGNDYVFVDLFEETLDDPAACAPRISDRRTGIGSDGLILLAPSQVADVKMEMFNADGTRAQMCGNGLRCLAKLARDRGRCAAKTGPIRVETDAGVRTVELTPEGARADMGPPRLEPESLPVRLPGPRVVDYPIEVDGEIFRMTCVSMGNPHAVFYVDDVRRIEVELFGSTLASQPIFPEQVNVSFVEVVDKATVLQRTWERGSGETLACGTGACAVCVAGVLTGRSGKRIESHLPGGVLLLEWDGANGVFMTGPAVEVFSGDWRGDGV